METKLSSSIKALNLRITEFEAGKAMPENPEQYINAIRIALLEEPSTVNVESLIIMERTIDRLIESEAAFTSKIDSYIGIVDEVLEADECWVVNTEKRKISNEFRTLIETNLRLELAFYQSNLLIFIAPYQEKQRFIEITGPLSYDKIKKHFDYKISTNATACLLSILRENKYIANISNKPLGLIMAPCFGHGAEAIKKALENLESDFSKEDYKELKELAQLIINCNPF